MAYKANIPASSDYFVASQKDIKENYKIIDEAFGPPVDKVDNRGDHVSLVNPDEAQRGMHRKNTFVVQSSAPSTAVNENALYSKDYNSKTEIYYRLESDGTEGLLTNNGAVAQNTLRLAAFVTFDFQGNIITRTFTNDSGEEVTQQLSYNVTSVTPVQPLVGGVNQFAEWDINFTTALNTVNYFWDMNTFSYVGNSIIRLVGPTNLQPRNDATYSNTITASKFSLKGYNTKDTTVTVKRVLTRMVFQAWTL